MTKMMSSPMKTKMKMMSPKTGNTDHKAFLTRVFMMTCRFLWYSACVWMLVVSSTFAMTIAEKREELETVQSTAKGRQELKEKQELIAEKRDALSKLYREIQDKLWSGDELPADKKVEIASQYKDRILGLRKEITALEEEWRSIASTGQDDEFEGLWHQPDTTVGQLVIDYASADYVYLMPPDVAGMKVCVSSRLSVPKASWGEMLDLVLASVGVGIKQLSPFVKQVYLLRLSQSGVFQITEDRSLLSTLPQEARIAFVCSPPSGDLRRIVQFLEKFVPVDQVAVQIIGGHLVLVGPVRDICDVMKIYDFVSAPQRAQEHHIVTLKNLDCEEVAKVLMSIFEGDSSSSPSLGGEPDGKPTMFMPQEASFGFRVMTLKQPASSLFLMGKHEQIDKACEIIKEIEESVGAVQEKSINYYACRHSDAEELAKVLSQVYTKLMGTSLNESPQEVRSEPKFDFLTQQREWIQAKEHAEDSLIVDSSPVSTKPQDASKNVAISENFIIDQKTNSIIMVVEKRFLAQLKELLHRLDVPKKMVQIDVLLFEKKVSDSSSIGLNLLRTGDAASDKNKEWVTWNDPISSRRGSRTSKKKKDKDVEKGILEFFISRKSYKGFPAFDVAYQFLLGQEDIQINANPSVTTVNQTPAKIAVVDQISINTGAIAAENDVVKDAYSRAEYGITIQITPTVHAKIDDDDSEGPKYVTLLTDVIFDSTRSDKKDRPDVTRRNIKNEVRVKDGESVILGGLRRKLSSGSQQSIPFLGEIPLLGKLFSSSTLADSSTEMFIFLTPRILPDEHEKWAQARYQELVKRPGDTPEFLQEVLEAKEQKKEMIMQRSIRMITGKPDATS